MVRTMVTKNKVLEVFAVIALFAAVVALLYVWTVSPLGTSERVGITTAISTVALVIVTGIYAYHTSKMAEEMREQRYAAARPKIDIQRDINVADIASQTFEANAALSEDTSHGLSCILHNIGVGPAIDVRSFIQHPESGRLPWDFGTLVTGRKTERMNLSLKHKNNRMALVAYYRDIYDQVFESSREVSIDKVGNAKWKIGCLKTIQLRRGIDHDKRSH